MELLLRAWLHFHWRNLSKFARSKVVQSAAVFPFLGYFLLINEKTQSLLTPPAGLQLWFRPQSELFLVYFGLFLIGTGVVVYNLRCPFLIKHFRDENECAQFYMQMATLGQVWAMLINVFGLPDHSPNPTHREIDRRYDEFNRDPEAWQKFLSTRREEIFGFYVSLYSRGDSERPISRAACFISLALGFLFLAVPSVDTFVAVSRAVL